MIVSPALNDIELVLLCGVYKGISMVKLCGLSCKRAILVNRTVPTPQGGRGGWLDFQEDGVFEWGSL